MSIVARLRSGLIPSGRREIALIFIVIWWRMAFLVPADLMRAVHGGGYRYARPSPALMILTGVYIYLGAVLLLGCCAEAGGGMKHGTARIFWRTLLLYNAISVLVTPILFVGSPATAVLQLIWSCAAILLALRALALASTPGPLRYGDSLDPIRTVTAIAVPAALLLPLRMLVEGDAMGWKIPHILSDPDIGRLLFSAAAGMLVGALTGLLVAAPKRPLFLLLAASFATAYVTLTGGGYLTASYRSGVRIAAAVLLSLGFLAGGAAVTHRPRPQSARA